LEHIILIGERGTGRLIVPRHCRDKAYFTNTMTLGQFVLMDFMKRKSRRV
jgi:hypothetical protein